MKYMWSDVLPMCMGESLALGSGPTVFGLTLGPDVTQNVVWEKERNGNLAL